jgi:class 3 adenylate cyclase
MSETRKLAAILVSDVVGYSRLAGADEDWTVACLRGLRSDLIDPAIAAHHGRVVKRTGEATRRCVRPFPHLDRAAHRVDYAAELDDVAVGHEDFNLRPVPRVRLRQAPAIRKAK